MSKERFDKTVGILVKAYMNDTLTHGECAACAVGNIVAARIGCDVVVGDHGAFFWVKDGKTFGPAWHHVFITRRVRQRINPRAYKGVVKQQIDLTEYTWQELARVEKVFEKTGKNYLFDDEKKFNSLMAVVDLLAKIDGISLEQTETARKLFVK